MRVGLAPSGTQPPAEQGAAHPVPPAAAQSTETVPTSKEAAEVAKAHYETPAILQVLSQTQTHISATPTPPPVRPGVPIESLTVSQEIPIVAPDPMAKYYAPVPCPPLPAQPTQSSTYTWPDSLDDVALGPAPIPAQPERATQPVAHTPPHEEPLFLDPSPPVVVAPIPIDSAANRALSSMALGRTLAEDLMDIEAGIPLPKSANPVLRNPLLVDATEEDLLLFSHIRPLQGDALVRAAGVLPEELEPARKKKTESAGPAPPAPTTEEPLLFTQEPPFRRATPEGSYDNPSLSQKLAHLTKLFPTASSEVLTIVLDKVDGELSAASAWMQSVSNVTAAKGRLQEAFPDAPSNAVEKSLRLYKGDFLLVFYGLTRDYKHTEEWKDFRKIRAKGVMDIGEAAPEFVSRDPATDAYEWQWWQVAVSIRKHRVAEAPAALAMWDDLAMASSAPRLITPRFVTYVERLRSKHTDPAGFDRAVATLRAQPDFQSIEKMAGLAKPCGPDEGRDAATIVLQTLLTDGYISPAAAAWLAIRISGSETMYAAMSPAFLGFPKIRRKLWNDRNTHLAAWSETNMARRERTTSPTGTRISAAETKSVYSGAAPAGRAKELHPIFTGKRTTGKAPVLPLKQRQAKEAQGKKDAIRAAKLAKKAEIQEALMEATQDAMEDGSLEEEE